MDCGETEKFVLRRPSLRNLTSADYGMPKPQQNKVRRMTVLVPNSSTFSAFFQHFQK